MLIVKNKKEIVAYGLPKKAYDMNNVGKYLNAQEFNLAMEDDNSIVMDMRNFYETEVGKFENAEIPLVEKSKDLLPEVRKMLVGREKSQVLLYCTGGIRCEKASAFLIKNGIINVKQLQGTFFLANKFKQPHIKYWDVRNCTDFLNIFKRCPKMDNVKGAKKNPQNNSYEEFHAVDNGNHLHDGKKEWFHDHINDPMPEPADGEAMTVEVAKEHTKKMVVKHGNTISIVKHFFDKIKELNNKGVRTHIRKSDHYSGNILDPLGLKNCVRVSMCHYNTEEEVLQFLTGINEIIHH